MGGVLTNHSWHTHPHTLVNRRARQGEICPANRQTHADLVDWTLTCRAKARTIRARVRQALMWQDEGLDEKTQDTAEEVGLELTTVTGIQRLRWTVAQQIAAIRGTPLCLATPHLGWKLTTYKCQGQIGQISGTVPWKLLLCILLTWLKTQRRPVASRNREKEWIEGKALDLEGGKVPASHI